QRELLNLLLKSRFQKGSESLFRKFGDGLQRLFKVEETLLVDIEMRSMLSDDYMRITDPDLLYMFSRYKNKPGNAEVTAIDYLLSAGKRKDSLARTILEAKLGTDYAAKLKHARKFPLLA